ncbi:MAG: protein-disulfide isomerase [Candidatus Paceibacteria bacterium]|jgi:protein-disulfide isomerase
MNEQPQQQPVFVAAAQPLWKDLLVPASIVIAGIAIGAGLYMSGGGATPSIAVAPQPGEPAAEVDRTDQVAEVTNDDHRKGSADAAITIVEYSDFDCPFCSRFHDSMNELVAANNDVAWVYRHFPLEQLHPQAEGVALASECVGDLAGESAFWSFTDGYFAARGAQDATTHDVLVPRLANAAGVSTANLQECLTSGRMQADVQADIDNAIATGGRGTPWSILIGPTGKTYPINGALPTAAIQQVIQVARDEA